MDAEEYNIFVVISDAAIKIQRLFRKYRNRKLRSAANNEKGKKHTFSFGGTTITERKNNKYSPSPKVPSPEKDQVKSAVKEMGT